MVVSEEGQTDSGMVLAQDEGELLIGGVGVARGYLHAPDLTTQVPIPY